MKSRVFDSNVSLNNITGLEQDAGNLSTPLLKENPTGDSKTDPKNPEDGDSSTGKNQSRSEGSQPGSQAAYYNGFNSKRRYV